jgi:hypothetical protein
MTTDNKLKPSRDIAKKDKVRSDAKGQFAKSNADRTNDGVSSANPRVLSGQQDGDATFPLKRKKT